MCLTRPSTSSTRAASPTSASPTWARRGRGRAPGSGRDPHLYGRFDLRYDGTGPAKLLEYNADTPTSLVEAAGRAVVLAGGRASPSADQWNSIHERLVDRWRGRPPCCRRARSTSPGLDDGRARRGGDDGRLPAGDRRAGGLRHRGASPWRTSAGTRSTGRFVDDRAAASSARCFKLYPWEWLVADPFGRHVRRSTTAAARHDLDRAAVEDAAVQQGAAGRPLGALPRPPQPAARLPRRPPRAGDLGYVAKPLLGREGAGDARSSPRTATGDARPYGAGGLRLPGVRRRCPTSTATRPVLGAWVVDDEAAGLGIRETTGLITDDTSSFVPHRIRATP